MISGEKYSEKEYRILFTGIGRRVELVQAFKRAAKKIGIHLAVFGTDMTDTAPAMHFCDYRRKICGMKERDYIPQLLTICRQDRIDILIPTIDTDLMILSEYAAQFIKIGTKVLISAPERVAICRDKSHTADFFIGCGVKSPIPVTDVKAYQGGFPCFIKPKDGSSSINAFRVDNEKDLEAYSHKVFDYIIQPFIEGTEYTVDIMCDFEGNPIYITPRERVAIRSGEVLKTQIALDGRMIEACKRIVTGFKPCGPITVQLIRQKESEEDYYIEINPRFGGGAPLSMKAGADSAEVILRLLRHESVGWEMESVRDGKLYSRYDQSICVNEIPYKNEIKAVVFDLDDTLYSEKEYVKSGFRAVAECISEIENVEEKLWNAFEKGLSAVDTVLEEEQIYTEELKRKCLAAYRKHAPCIHFNDNAEMLLKTLRNAGYKLGVITDGRPEGQRAKIEALRLKDLVDEIIITDELGGPHFRKPCDIAFRIMKEKIGCDFEEVLYVGDNPSKDFDAPQVLGMGCVYLKNREGLYSVGAFNGCTVESLSQIPKVLENWGGGDKLKPQIGQGLIIIGTGGHGKVVADIAAKMKRYSQIAFVDDDLGKYRCGCYKIIGKISSLVNYLAGNDIFVAIGDNQIRRKVQELVEGQGGTIATLIDPDASIGSGVELGDGCVVMPAAVINCGTVIGDGTIVNTSSSIDHECVVGDYCHIAVGSRLAGAVCVVSNTFIGAGAVVRNNVNICGECVVGAGAVVVEDIKEAGKYIGVPAQKMVSTV